MRSPVVPFAVALLAIAIFCCLDALMKGLGLAMGAYSALLWRSGIGVPVTGVLWAATRPAWPAARLIRLHVGRGLIVAAMTVGWFHAITLIPLAEAVAISFFAPLLALLLAGLWLGERVTARAVAGSCLGLAGVAAIVAGRLGAAHGPRTAEGIACVIGSATLYAINLVLQRHQAQQAPPAEIAFFQTATVLVCLLPFAGLAATPVAGQWPLIAGAAVCTSTSLLLLSWAYARAPAAALLPTEYTAFLWLSLFGALFFGEALTVATLAGAALVMGGCWLAVRAPAPAVPQAALL